LLHARTTSQCLHGERGIGFDARACGERAAREKIYLWNYIWARGGVSGGGGGGSGNN